MLNNEKKNTQTKNIFSLERNLLVSKAELINSFLNFQILIQIIYLEEKTHWRTFFNEANFDQAKTIFKKGKKQNKFDI